MTARVHIPKPFPYVTLIVFLLTAAVTAFQFINPAVLENLRRNQAALSDGQYWRLISPVLVHSDGWVQIILNLLGILIVGIFMEQRWGAVRWLVLYLAGGFVGNLAGYLWDPNGAGASVAVCGLMGSLLVLLIQRERVPLAAVIYTLCLIAALIGAALMGSIAAVIFAAIVGSIIGTFAFRNLNLSRILPYLAAAGMLAGLILSALHDNHGPALLIGVALGMFFLSRDAKPSKASAPAA